MITNNEDVGNAKKYETWSAIDMKIYWTTNAMKTVSRKYR